MPRNSINPLLNELHSMKRKMDALYLETLTIEGAADAAEPAETVDWQPAIDIWQTPDEWVLLADIPGVPDSELQVQVVDNKLTIQGRRESLPGLDGAEPIQRERPKGYFSRTFILTREIRQDSIRAEFKSGVLTVVIPKASPQGGSPHKITVQTA